MLFLFALFETIYSPFVSSVRQFTSRWTLKHDGRKIHEYSKLGSKIVTGILGFRLKGISWISCWSSNSEGRNQKNFGEEGGGGGVKIFHWHRCGHEKCATLEKFIVVSKGQFKINHQYSNDAEFLFTWNPPGAGGWTVPFGKYEGLRLLPGRFRPVLSCQGESSESFGALR